MSFQNDHILDMYPLSPMQKGMLFHSLEEGTDSTYLVQIVTPVRGDLESNLWLRSFELLIERHEVFRTTFLYEGMEEPLQIVLGVRPMQVIVKKAALGNPLSGDAFVRDYLHQDRARGFHVTIDPLIRSALLQTGEKEWVIVITFHHILMDGWCSDLIFHDLFRIYASLKTGVGISLSQPEPYSRYIQWLEDRDNVAAGEYWKSCLKGFQDMTGLPYLQNKDTSHSYSPKNSVLSLGSELTGRLLEISKKCEVTPSSLFQTIWGILLQKMNNCHDAVFGSVVTGRPSDMAGVDHMVGLFINTLPLRVQTRENQNFVSLVQQTHRQILESQEFAHYPLSRIQHASTEGVPLFDHIVVFDKQTEEELWREIAGGLGLELGEQSVIEHTNYDMSVVISLHGDELAVKLIYNANAINEGNVHKLFQYFLNVTKRITSNPLLPVRDIALLSPEAAETILCKNRIFTDYPKDRTIGELFEEQTEKNPNGAALVLEGQYMTYGELNMRANGIAYYLQRRGVKPDQLVGLFADKSFELIIAILGILKSGGAYVPMDPDHPDERISMILEDSEIQILLIQRHYEQRLTEELNLRGMKESLEICILEDLLVDPQPEWKINPKSNSHSRHLGHVMYTSGSTGRPKGILTQQNSIIRVVKHTNYIDITEEDVILQLSNAAFDSSTFDIFGALLNGARLVLIPKEAVLEMGKLLDVIVKEKITVFFTTTALFNTLIDCNIESLGSVRKVLFGGERVSLVHVKKALANVGMGKILHMYGPTESTVFATFHEVNVIDEELGTVPIGIPIANTEILILSRENHLQPPGMIGELCVAGDGLARGYLHNDTLTSQKFEAHPFSPGERMYRTGDLARWLDDGTIEFIGRADHQVKLRGFRIELGEIEYRMLSMEGINEAFVTDCLDPGGGKVLCAYYSCQGKADEFELRNRLASRLPAYMLPSYFIKMKALPLTPNGKVDRKQLPSPDWSDFGKHHFGETRDPLEELVAAAWQEVLGVGRVGLSDNYYQLGGDSIKAIQICARLRESELELNVSDLLRNPTIKELKPCVRQMGAHKGMNPRVSKNSVLSDNELLDLENELRSSLNQR